MMNEQKTTLTTQEVAARFHTLAEQGKWFEIQDEFFAENVRSVEPLHSPYFDYAEGKAAVRKKGEDFVSRVQALHGDHITEPLVTGNHFVVGREMDLTVQPHGRQQIKQLMLYEVKGGQITLEQFFY